MDKTIRQGGLILTTVQAPQDAHAVLEVVQVGLEQQHGFLGAALVQQQQRGLSEVLHLRRGGQQGAQASSLRPRAAVASYALSISSADSSTPSKRHWILLAQRSGVDSATIEPSRTSEISRELLAESSPGHSAATAGRGRGGGGSRGGKVEGRDEAAAADANCNIGICEQVSDF